MRKLGQLARDPVKIGQPLLFVALCLIWLADVPSTPPEQAPSQRWPEISRLVHKQRDQNGGQQEAEHSASHRAAQERSNSATGLGLLAGARLPVRCRTAPRRSVSSARAPASPSALSR